MHPPEMAFRMNFLGQSYVGDLTPLLVLLHLFASEVTQQNRGAFFKIGIHDKLWSARLIKTTVPTSISTFSRLLVAGSLVKPRGSRDASLLICFHLTKFLPP
jgi:hypothetical protein